MDDMTRRRIIAHELRQVAVGCRALAVRIEQTATNGHPAEIAAGIDTLLERLGDVLTDTREFTVALSRRREEVEADGG